MVTIDEIKMNRVQVGSKLEITIKEGAEFDHDPGPGGNDPAGFVPVDKMIDSPGLVFTGYVSSFGGKPTAGRIFLNQGWVPHEGRAAGSGEGGSQIYFQEETIYSYKKE